MPLPGGWPVSSKFPYPAADHRHERHDDRLSPPTHLRPGGLLRRSCNGSDVFLRKRAVQSASASLFNVAKAGGGAGGGGPTRFLIIFPGRVSLRSPPRAASGTVVDDAATAAAASAVAVGNGGDIVADDDEDNYRENDDDDGPDDDDDGGTMREGCDDAKVAAGNGGGRRRNPFAPAHPPRLLGRLVPTSGGDGGRVELRIPFPPANEDDGTNTTKTTTTTGEKVRELVMSGMSVPIPGKYMALSFKRTGGTRESVSSLSGGGKNGKGGRIGNGSITCKDVFRSVIVLGESHLLDEDGKAGPLGMIASSTKASGDGDEELRGGSCVQMKHYGGSERTVDGGGRCDGGGNGGRKSSSGGVAKAAAARTKRVDGGLSKEIDLESGGSMEVDAGDNDETGGSSDVDEFVPTAPKRKKSTEGSKKRKQLDDSDDEEEEEEITFTRDRAPRRSVTAAKVSYVDESSDSDQDGDESDRTAESSRDDRSAEEAKNRPKGISKAIQPDSKKNAPKLASSKGSGKGKGGSVGSKSTDQGMDRIPRGVPNGKKPLATNNILNGAAALKVAIKKVPPAASMKKSNDVIEIKSDDDDGERMSTPTKRLDVHKKSPEGISADTTKKLTTSSPASKSPSKSPISYGRRKKNSPKVEKGSKRNEIDLSWDDDDPFIFK
jgi:hypothetical protein